MTQLPEPTRHTLPAAASPHGAQLDEITLSVHQSGPKEGTAVVLCHGFPELAYSWRHQVAAIGDAGFRVIAPDQRGYGASDCPGPIEQYDMEHLCGDLARLLDDLGIEKAVFAGHDWGGFVAWGMPILYPDRTAGVIGVNTPYMPFAPTKVMRQMVSDDEKLYILWFQKPGVAEGVLDQDPGLVFEKLMRRGAKPDGTLAERAASSGDTDANPFRRLAELPTMGNPLLTDDELSVYASAFATSGFHGGVSWYRNIDRNFEQFPAVGTQKLDLPCLMVTAEWDMALRPELAAGMPALCSDLETHMISECGHWTQQEKPEELNGLMVDWLKRRFA
jgi:pimeloyl-ACP methyl ester carboxylesterase